MLTIGESNKVSSIISKLELEAMSVEELHNCGDSIDREIVKLIEEITQHKTNLELVIAEVSKRMNKGRTISGR